MVWNLNHTSGLVTGEHDLQVDYERRSRGFTVTNVSHLSNGYRNTEKKTNILYQKTCENNRTIQKQIRGTAAL